LKEGTENLGDLEDIVGGDEVPLSANPLAPWLGYHWKGSAGRPMKELAVRVVMGGCYAKDPRHKALRKQAPTERRGHFGIRGKGGTVPAPGSIEVEKRKNHLKGNVYLPTEQREECAEA